MQKKQLEINQTKTVYWESGKGEPLLLLHGWLYTKESFEKIIPLLSKRYHIIVPDLPGFGESESLAEEEVEDYLAFIEDFTTKLGWSKFNLLGNSFGGTLSLLYAIENPGQINKLVVRVPLYKRQQIHFLLSNKLSRAFFAFSSKFVLFQKLFRKLIIKLHDRVNTNGEHHSENSRVLQQNLANLSLTAARNLIISGLYLDIEPSLKNLSIDILIIWASEDKLLNPKSAEDLHNLLPNSQLAFTPGPHSIFAAEAKLTAELILNFLES